jgi:hypothetical protein
LNYIYYIFFFNFRLLLYFPLQKIYFIYIVLLKQKSKPKEMNRSTNHFSSLSEERLDPDSDGEQEQQQQPHFSSRKDGSFPFPINPNAATSSAQTLFDAASTGLRREIASVNYKTADDQVREVSTGACQNYAMIFMMARKKFLLEMEKQMEINPMEKKKIFEHLLASVTCLAAVGEAYMRISALCVHGEHFDGVAQNWFNPALHHILEAQSESDAAHAQILSDSSDSAHLNSFKQMKMDQLSQSICIVYEDGKNQIASSLDLKTRLSEELAANIAARDEIRAKMAARNGSSFKKNYRGPPNPAPNPFTIERERLKARLAQVSKFLMEVATSEDAMARLAHITGGGGGGGEGKKGGNNQN